MQHVCEEGAASSRQTRNMDAGGGVRQTMADLVVHDVITEEQFEAVAKAYRGVLIRSAVNILGNAEDAEDSVQSGLMLAWERRNQFQARNGATFSTWIFTVVCNAARAQTRRRASRRYRHHVSIAQADVSDWHTLLSLEQSDFNQFRVQTIKRCPTLSLGERDLIGTILEGQELPRAKHVMKFRAIQKLKAYVGRVDVSADQTK